MAFQEIEISGFVGQDAKASQTKDGRKVTNFNMCVNTRRNGEDVPQWYSVACWDDLADVAGHLRKGSEVTVKASAFWPVIEEYTNDKNEQVREPGMKLIAGRIHFHGRKPENGN